jgi:hypothetical protein
MPVKEKTPNGRWWIKADACDVRSGLMESMRQNWLGDCDLGDGKVQALHQKYITYLAYIQGIGLGSRKNDILVTQDIKSLLAVLHSDESFLTKALQATSDMK